MASIGGITCTFLKGVVPALKEEAAITRRPGMNGFEIHLTGQGDSQGRLRAVLYSNTAGCRTWEAAVQALQGTVVTVVNDHGDTTTGVYVVHAAPPERRAAYRPGATITQRSEIALEVLRVA
jgi:hypothetical protein